MSERLEIFTNPKNARSGALFMGILSSFLMASFIAVLLLTEVEWGGMILTLICFTGAIWLFTSFFASSWRLYRFSRLDSPLLVLEPSGVTLHEWSRPVRFSWHELKSVNWHQHAASHFLEFHPSQRPLRIMWMDAVGLSPLKFGLQYLEVDPALIDDFLVRHGGAGTSG